MINYFQVLLSQAPGRESGASSYTQERLSHGAQGKARCILTHGSVCFVSSLAFDFNLRPYMEGTRIECEAPNNQLYKFEGKWVGMDPASARAGAQEDLGLSVGHKGFHFIHLSARPKLFLSLKVNTTTKRIPIKMLTSS